VSGQNELVQRIDAIERAYEYLLAYAAQGRTEEAGSDARPMLEQMYASLDGLGALARSALSAGSSAGGADFESFLTALDRDASVARGAVGLVLSRAKISSLLVDNLNASVHVRALLTDLFLLEQALKS